MIRPQGGGNVERHHRMHVENLASLKQGGLGVLPLVA
jgi:hypothetical protein